MADSSAHMLRTFDAEMREVRERFRAMATRCRDQLHLALDAFWSGSKEKVDRVEISDVAVDAEEKSIDDLVLRLLALRQPVASDLRTLTALFKLVTDLERIGDEAVDIARGTAPTSPDADGLRARLREMAETSENMFESAVSSFLDRDAAAAEAVRRVNGVVDATYEKILGDAITLMSHHSTEVASATASMNVAKCLSRIADHAKNIAEGTIFVVQGGEMPR